MFHSTLDLIKIKKVHELYKKEKKDLEDTLLSANQLSQVLSLAGSYVPHTLIAKIPSKDKMIIYAYNDHYSGG